MQCRIANVSSSPLPLADRYNYGYTRSSEHSIFQQIRETDVNTNQRPAKINISQWNNGGHQTNNAARNQ